ncbi:hypothetical protein BC941DRAFT_416307 [Chlamydoabsidia padenii]|nr:hypothetical protein BC941DRAFT_416307 [Chlamydoabsidia padenii]
MANLFLSFSFCQTLTMAHREGITTQTHDWSMVQASYLIKNQNVIEIAGNTPVEIACSVLVDNNISSAPVYSHPDQSTNEQLAVIHTSKSYIGCFDYADVIAYLLLVLRSSTADESGSLELQDIVKRALDGQQVPVSLASDLSQKNPFCSVLPEATLASVVEEFSCGIHRVSVMNPDGRIKGILSQSTVVKYFYENKYQFPEISALFNKTLRELNLGQTDVVSVDADTLVLDALAQMNQHNVSSVAVLGNMGVIMGNISMTDVKYVLKSSNHRLLWDTCFRFVSLIRNKQGIDDGEDRLPVFDVRLETTLGYSIAKLLATAAHRVWVTDETGRATGVLTMTDVMMVVSSLSRG